MDQANWAIYAKTKIEAIFRIESAWTADQAKKQSESSPGQEQEPKSRNWVQIFKILWEKYGKQQNRQESENTSVLSTVFISIKSCNLIFMNYGERSTP